MATSKKTTLGGGTGTGGGGTVSPETLLSLLPVVSIIGATVEIDTEDGTQYVDIEPKIQEVVTGMNVGGAASAASVIAILRANGITVSPPAPTGLVIDNDLDTASWTPAVGYENAMHEITIDNGTNWSNQTATGSKTAITGDVPMGYFKVRVKADTNQNAGASLSSTSPFIETGGAPQTLSFSTAHNLSGTSNAYTNTGGAFAYGGATRKIPANTNGYAYFRYTSNTQFGFVLGTKNSVADVSDANALEMVIDIAGDGNIGVRGTQGGEEYLGVSATVNTYYRINYTARGTGAPKAQVQRSTDLINWINIGSLLNSHNGDVFIHIAMLNNTTKTPTTIYAVNTIPV